MDALEGQGGLGETIERLTGVYRVLKPHLVAVYTAHPGGSIPVYEPPTRRILDRCLADERRHIADGGRPRPLARTRAIGTEPPRGSVSCAGCWTPPTG